MSFADQCHCSTGAISTACYTRHWVGGTGLIGFGCATTPFVETVYTTNSEGAGQLAQVYTFGNAVSTGPSSGTPTNGMTSLRDCIY